MAKNFPLVWVLGLAGFLVMANNWIMSLLLPAIAVEFGLTVSQASIVITTYMLSFGLAQLFFGPLADQYGKFRVIMFSLNLFILTTALCLLAMDITTLAVLRAFSGAFAAAVMPISNALISDLFPAEKRQSALGLFQGLANLGQGLSMALGGVVGVFLGWRGIFAFLSFLGTISVFLFWLNFRGLDRSQQKNKLTGQKYRSLFRKPLVRRTYFLIFAEGALIGGLFSYLGAFLVLTHGLNDLGTGMIMTAFGVTAALGSNVSGCLVGKWGSKTTLLLGLGVGVIASFSLLVAGDFLCVVVVALVFLGLAYIIIHPTLLTIIAEFSEEGRGLAMSLVACSYMLGSGAGTILGGFLLARTGYPAIFLASGVGFLLLVGFPKWYRRLPKQSGINFLK